MPFINNIDIPCFRPLTREAPGPDVDRGKASPGRSACEVRYQCLRWGGEFESFVLDCPLFKKRIEMLVLLVKWIMIRHWYHCNFFLWFELIILFVPPVQLTSNSKFFVTIQKGTGNQCCDSHFCEIFLNFWTPYCHESSLALEVSFQDFRCLPSLPWISYRCLFRSWTL